MFRPEGWEEIKETCRLKSHEKDIEDREDIFELGADAMLEGLRKKGQRFGAAHNPFTSEWKEAYTQVCIPEDKK